MNVSVALPTYNGTPYLSEQLDSILHQTRPPDQIIVCDDGSTDGTRDVLADYRDRYPDLFEIQHNEENLGVNPNFEKAIQLCDGDLIALADQDDIWKPEKLERQCRAYREADPTPTLVYHNSTITDESLEPQYSLWDPLRHYPGRNETSREHFEHLVEQNYVQGATVLFDADLREHVLPMVDDRFPHDYWMAMVAALTGTLCEIDEELLLYRQHDEQDLGAPTPASVSKYARLLRKNLTDPSDVRRFEMQKWVERWEILYRRMAELDPEVLQFDLEWALSVVEELLEFYRRRTAIFDETSRRKRTRWVVDDLRSQRYRRFHGGLPQAAKDLTEIYLPWVLG